MATDIAALAVSVISLVVALVAIGIALRLSGQAEHSLRKSTKVAVLATGRVLRLLSESRLPDESEIVELGGTIWRISKTAYLVEPGGSIELAVEVIGDGPGPLYYPDQKIPTPRWDVTTPSGVRFSGEGGSRRYDELHYCWWLVYPHDFAGADSKEEGIYTVGCSVPDENYKRLFAAFFVLS